MNFDHDLGLIDSILTIDTSIAPPLGGNTNSLLIKGTGALYLPVGTTGERPTNSVGMIRWNTTTGSLEINDGAAWIIEGTGSVTSVAIASDTTTNSALTVVSGSPITGAGTIHLALGSELVGLAGLASTGLVTHTGAGTYSEITITGTASNITVSNGNGVLGNPIINLATVTQGASGTSFVKVQLDSYGRVINNVAVGQSDITGALTYTPVNKAGDTMSGNLAMGGNQVTGLPAVMTDPTTATSKAYVDALVTSGTKWKNPVVDPDIQDTVAATGFEANAFVAMGDGQTYTYIATAGFTFAGQGGGTSYAAVTNDVVTLLKTGSVGDWSFVDNVNAGDRYIIAGEHGTIGSTLYGVGFRKNDVIQYVSGAANLYSSWTTPEDASYQVINFTSAKTSASVTLLVNATVYDLNVKINGTNYNITVTADASYTFGELATDLTTGLNAAHAGASCVLEPEGHFHIFSGDGTKVIVSEGTGANPLLAGLSTDFAIANIRSNILAGIIDGATVLVNDPQSKHYGHTYIYTEGINSWTEIAGPGAVGAGIGLSYSGTVLNVNLGAGVAQLPSDEVGIDIYVGGGLMTTTDGTASSTLTNAQLSLTKVGTAATYTSVTTDAYGRVTAGSSPTPPYATTAGVALAVEVTTVATGTFYPALVNAATGNLAVDATTGISFNAATNNLTTTTFTGALVGNADTATLAVTATTATNSLNSVVTTVSSNATYYPTFVSAASGNLAIDAATGLTFNPSTNTLTTVTFVGNLTGNVSGSINNATTATNAINVGVTAVATNASFYPTFVSATTGNVVINVDASGITYNPSTNDLSTTTFTGALVGNADTATLAATATNAINVGVTAVSSNATYYPTFVSATTGNVVVDVGTGLTFNPNTNTLTTTTFVGNLTGTASNALTLEGMTWEAPGTIGSTTANTAVFTDLTATNSVSVTHGNFATFGDAKYGIYVLRNQTTTATETELFLNGTSTQIILPITSVFTFKVTVVGRKTNALSTGAGYTFEGVILRDTTTGSTAFIGKPSKQVLGETVAAWDAKLYEDLATGALSVKVTGAASTNINWVATVQTTEVRN